jgi:LPS export ABC transporter protein LptC
MIYRKIVFLIFLIFLTTIVFAQEQNSTEAEQQINDFSLAGYGEKGKKSWDLSGKSADIFTDVIKLKDLTGNLYGKEEDIKLTAKKGHFNKTDGKVHLEENVVITSSGGTKLTTDSLDWDRKNQLVTSPDIVNIQRENMIAVALGAKGEPGLKNIVLEKDVKVNINPVNSAQGKEKIIITCDGPLEIDYEKNIATFNNNVKVERIDSTIYSDKMDVYFSQKPVNKDAKEVRDVDQTKESPELMATKIEKIIARGNVKIVRGENISYSQEAIYTAADKKITLTGRPKLIIYSTEEFKDAFTGN